MISLLQRSARLAALPEILRRVYHELVRRRTRTRIVYVDHAVHDLVAPIFVLGCYRSGTTLIRYVLDSHPNIACPPETDFLIPLVEMVRKPVYTTGLSTLGLDQTAADRKVLQWANELYSAYAFAQGKTRWADKTPSYIDIADDLARIFPLAKFVCITRHPLDQIHSFTTADQGFRDICRAYLAEPESDIRLGAARYWAKQTRRIREFEKSHPARVCMLRYKDVCLEPESQLRLMFRVVEEPWCDNVMQFWSSSHDIGREDGRVGASRGFRFSGGAYRAWDKAVIEECWSVVADAAAELGYSLEAP